MRPPGALPNFPDVKAARDNHFMKVNTQVWAFCHRVKSMLPVRTAHRKPSASSTSGQLQEVPPGTTTHSWLKTTQDSLSSQGHKSKCELRG